MLAEETWTVRGGEIREVHAALRPRCGDWTLKRFENTGDGQTDTRHARSLICLGETAGGEWPAVLTYFSLIWDSSNQCDKLILLSPLLGSFAEPKRCRSTSMLSVNAERNFATCWCNFKRVRTKENRRKGSQNLKFSRTHSDSRHLLDIQTLGMSTSSSNGHTDPYWWYPGSSLRFWRVMHGQKAES